MRKYHIALRIIVIVIILSAVAMSCSRYGGGDAQSTEFATFIKAHTSGVITDKSTIRVELASSIPDAEPGADLKDGILTFSPALKGTARWLSSSMIEFIPKSGELRSGTSYTAKLRLDKIQKVGDHNFKKYTFKFLVAIKEAVLHQGDVIITAASRDIASVDGTISLTEELPLETVQEMLSFSYPEDGAEASVTAGNDPLHFKFEIVSLKRSDKDRNLKIRLKSGDTGFLTDSQLDVVIPSTEGFKVTQAQLVESDGPHIQITFSDALDEDADYTGMFTLEGAGQIHQRINDDIVRLYFDNPNGAPVTLDISEDVKSHNGTRMGQSYSKTFKFQEEKPAVVIPVKGNILPDSKSLVLPFKAVNLKAVDIRVIQIYQENVLMFLQDNDLDGSNSLRRAGRLVCRRCLHLNSDPSKDLHKWQNYSIDLSKLFRQEPGAIYRVLISFKQEYSVYGENDSFRNGAPSDELVNIASEDITPEDDAEWDRAQPYWYEDFYDWDEYSWQDRDNPLKPTYYMESYRFPSINLLTSNLGVIAKYSGGDRLWVSVTDLMSSKPVFNSELYVYSYQLKEIGYAKTGTDGNAEIQLSGKPFAVVAKRGGATSYLKVSDGDEKSLSRFDVGGKVLDEGLKAYIYGERGVWRPADTLHVTLMLEDKEDRIPDSHPVSMEVYTPQGQFYTKLINSNGRDGVYVFNVPTKADDPTGTWHSYFKVGGATFHKALMIEDVKPNRLKVSLNLESDMLEGGKETAVDITSSWLSGPPASGLAADVNMTLRRGSSTFKGYEGYVFTSPLSRFEVSEYDLVDTVLGEDGHSRTMVSMPSAGGAPGMLVADFLTSVQEEGGDISFSTMSLPYSPYGSYVGIKVPDMEDGFLDTGREHSFKVASVDKNGKSVAGVNLTYSIYKMKWSWWWESRAEDLDSYVNSPSAEPVKTGDLVSGGNGCGFSFKAEDSEWGRYLVIVKDNDSGHSCGTVFYADTPGLGGRAFQENPNGLSMLTFSTDKKSYDVGETVKVFIPTPSKGSILVSLENSREVLSREWVKASGAGPVQYSFKVTPEMAPNFYVHVTLVQPHERADNDLPVRLYGVQPVMVNDKDSRLEPQIVMPDVLRPEQEFTVKVKEKDGKPMTYTLAIVDEGLLDLTSFKTPDPWNSMYEREALGVRTWDLYDDVIGAFSGRFSPMFSIGGDESLLRGSKKDNRFNPVVKFIGPYTLQSGSASHKIKLPMYVGSVRVMVVAASGTAAYGSADKTVQVKSPLMTLTSLPRILSEGEKVSMPVNVFVLEDGVRDIKVSVKADGPVRVVGNSTESVRFDSTGDKVVRFSLEASGTGTARIDITAEGGGKQAHETITLQVRKANPPVLTNTSLLIGKGETRSFSFTPFESGEDDWAGLGLSVCPVLNSEVVFSAMTSFPYRCTEQLASMGISLLSIRGSLSEKKQEQVDRIIPDLIQQICQRQASDGGFILWSNSQETGSWITSMAGEFLLMASQNGYSVSKGVLASWSRFQKKAVQDYRNSSTGYLWDLGQAYRLYTLALGGETESGAMNRLKEVQNLSVQAVWMLASAYSVSGKKAVAKEMISSLKPDFSAYRNGDETYGSPLRDKAMALESMALSDQTGLAFELAGDIAREISEGLFSTQEAAFASKAMKCLADKAGNGMLSAEVTCGSKCNTVSSSKPEAKVDVEPESGSVKIENTSDGVLHAVLTLSQTPDPGTKVDARAEGVAVKVAYKSRDFKDINPKEIPQGTEFIAIITVTNNSAVRKLDNMAVLMTVPSGWEVVNDRLISAEGVSDMGGYDSFDLRDDRAIWHFSLPESSYRTFKVRLKAAYEGEFILPAVKCEALYDPHVFACTASSTTAVTR